MSWISEDPWPVTGTLVVIAVICFLLVRFTQRGKFLIWALAAIVVAALLLVIEHFWVTDRERIEATLYAIAHAAEQSDYKALETFLAPEFEKPGLITRALIRGKLEATEFEFIHISSLQISEPGRFTRQSTAELIARASWRERTTSGSSDFNATPVAGTRWSFGFREVEPKVWKVTRIDLIDTGLGNVSAEDALKNMPR
jgi:hypothetical protein